MNIFKPEWHEIKDEVFVATAMLTIGKQVFEPGDEIPRSVRADGQKRVTREVIRRKPVLDRRGRKRTNHLGQVMTEKVAKMEPVLDDDGNTVVLPSGQPKLQIKYKRDKDGTVLMEPVLNDDGSPVVEQVVEPVLDKKGNPKMEFVLDEEGRKIPNPEVEPYKRTVKNKDGKDEEEEVVEFLTRPVVETKTVEKTQKAVDWEMDEVEDWEDAVVDWNLDEAYFHHLFDSMLIGPLKVREPQAKVNKKGVVVLNKEGAPVYEMVEVDCEWTKMLVEHNRAAITPPPEEEVRPSIPEKYRKQERVRESKRAVLPDMTDEERSEKVAARQELLERIMKGRVKPEEKDAETRGEGGELPKDAEARKIMEEIGMDESSDKENSNDTAEQDESQDTDGSADNS